jgi:hypothetical protein
MIKSKSRRQARIKFLTAYAELNFIDSEDTYMWYVLFYAYYPDTISMELSLSIIPKQIA